MKYCGCMIAYSAYSVFVLTFLMAINFYTPIVIIFLLLTAALVVWGIQVLEKEEVKTITQNSKYEDKITKKTAITDKDKKIFKECWLYTDFIKKFGNIKEIRTFINSNTGKPFKSCIINTKDKNRLYLNFSSSLGELTLSEITKRKKELKVGLASSGNYKLYDDSIPEWKTIDFNEPIEEKAVKEDNLETSENKENFNTINDNSIQKLNPYMTDLFRARGIDYNEEEVMNKYQELCQTIYDGSEDYEVNLLNKEQKYALFGLMALMGKYHVLKDKEEVHEILKDFAKTIDLDTEECNKILKQCPLSKYDYVNVIKNIKLNYPINMLFDTWRELTYIDESKSQIISQRMKWAFKEIGWTFQEYSDFLNGRYIHKYT